MRHIFPLSILLPLFCIAAPFQSRAAIETDSDYLQHRAAGLKGRIDSAVRKHRVSRREGARLRLTVGQVQTEAGHLQAVSGTISRPDADRMNQKLTDVERTLTR